MMNQFDLHLHTTASDGTWTPQEVVRQAVAFSMQAIAFTDHDTLVGFWEAEPLAAETEIELFAGVELNTDIEGFEVDILGYFAGTPGTAFLAMLDGRQQGRIVRAQEITRKLNAIGLDIDYGRVREIAHGAVCRPHIAQAMIEQGIVQNQHEAYRQYLGLGAPAHVEHDELDAVEAIRQVRSAGGVPVIAHPGLIGNDDLVVRLIQVGAEGLEAYYPEHSSEDKRRYVDMARRHDLIVTAGTDCHGPGRKKSYPMGSVAAPPELLSEFRTRLRRDIGNLDKRR